MVMFTVIPVVLLSSCILYHLLFEVLGILKPFFKEGFKPPEARTFFNVFIKDSYNFLLFLKSHRKTWEILQDIRKTI